MDGNFHSGIEENNEKILEATQDEVSASKRGRKCAKIKTEITFENTNDSYVKFRPEIEKTLEGT